MHSKLSNKELVAAGHHFAANLSSDTPLIDMAKMVSELATQLDVALVVAAEAGKQRDEMAVEASYFRQQIKQHSQSTHFCHICGKDDLCHNDDVCWALGHPMPATDAYLNEVRAEGVEMFAAQQRFIGKEQEQIREWEFARHCSISANEAIEFAAQLRAGKDGV